MAERFHRFCSTAMTRDGKISLQETRWVGEITLHGGSTLSLAEYTAISEAGLWNQRFKRKQRQELLRIVQSIIEAEGSTLDTRFRWEVQWLDEREEYRLCRNFRFTGPTYGMWEIRYHNQERMASFYQMKKIKPARAHTTREAALRWAREIEANNPQRPPTTRYSTPTDEFGATKVSYSHLSC